ncbi:MAG: hypothetical protein GTO41_22100 [Burkholderiales bacterium]|nr:hypothetical protein [Burkholderiales bacterium]
MRTPQRRHKILRYCNGIVSIHSVGYSDQHFQTILSLEQVCTLRIDGLMNAAIAATTAFGVSHQMVVGKLGNDNIAKP